MKYLTILLLLTACGTANDQQQQQQNHYYSMTWNCGNNSKCARDEGAWYGSGTFQVESDCLAWETAFINNYQGSSVTACTYH